MSDALEEHHKRLSLFRLNHPRMKKVVLKEDVTDSDFASYVPLEDFWPHGHANQPNDNSKPVMLNSRAELSLLRKEAMPWSPEHRSLGSRSKHHHQHQHHHNAAFLEKSKNATKTEKPATMAVKTGKSAMLVEAKKKSVLTKTTVNITASKAHNMEVAAKKKAAVNITASSRTTTAINKTSANASKAGSKVVALSNSSKFAMATKAPERTEKK